MSDAVKLGLVNNAMAHLGEPGFASLDLDPAPPKLVKALGALDGPAGVELWVLARHPWLTALSYATLTPAEYGANWRFAHAFELPDTFVKLWRCDACDFEAGTQVLDGGAVRKVVRADAASLDVAYTERRPYAAYGPDLLHVMALELASRTAGPIQENKAKAADLAKRALEALAMAQGGEANQHGGGEPVFAGGFAQLRRLGA